MQVEICILIRRMRYITASCFFSFFRIFYNFYTILIHIKIFFCDYAAKLVLCASKQNTRKISRSQNRVKPVAIIDINFIIIISIIIISVIIAKN